MPLLEIAKCLKKKWINNTSKLHCSSWITSHPEISVLNVFADLCILFHSLGETILSVPWSTGQRVTGNCVKKVIFLVCWLQEKARIKDLFKLKQNLFTPSISKWKEILIKGKHFESYLMVWYHPMIFPVTQIERSIILYSLYCGCISKRAPYFIFSELFIHGLKIKLFSELWSCVLRLKKSTTHDLHVYKYK